MACGFGRGLIAVAATSGAASQRQHVFRRHLGRRFPVGGTHHRGFSSGSRPQRRITFRAWRGARRGVEGEENRRRRDMVDLRTKEQVDSWTGNGALAQAKALHFCLAAGRRDRPARGRTGVAATFCESRAEDSEALWLEFRPMARRGGKENSASGAGRPRIGISTRRAGRASSSSSGRGGSGPVPARGRTMGAISIALKSSTSGGGGSRDWSSRRACASPPECAARAGDLRGARIQPPDRAPG